MELYILDNDYNRADIIEEFESAIWTERFIDPGDVKITIQGTWANYKLLKPGTLINLRGSREVMILEDRSVEDGLMTVNGKTIEYFFDERFMDKTILTGAPGEILGGMVDQMQARHDRDYAIPRLRTGSLDDSDTRIIKVAQFGPVHTALLELAKKYGIGMAVLWTRKDRQHEFVFTTRKGIDRTSHQDKNPLVRFSPHLDNLANVKEFLSVADSKTTVIVNPPKIPVAEGMGIIKISNIDKPKKTLEHFTERIIEINCADMTEERFGVGTDYEKRNLIYDSMMARAKGALLYNKKARVIDGEITPASQYKYGKDYLLGDWVEIQGFVGDPVTGIVNEHIRSHDGTGERSYPTVTSPSDSVIDEIFPT